MSERATDRPRIDYDAVAPVYDDNPVRKKEVDPHLICYITERGTDRAITAIDLSCGTGNQLIANAATYPGLCLVGLDFSIGMLRQAQKNEPRCRVYTATRPIFPFATRAAILPATNSPSTTSSTKPRCCATSIESPIQTHP